MYTDYDSEIYFLIDPRTSPFGAHSDTHSTVELYKSTGTRVDQQNHNDVALGHTQQPALNFQPNGDQL
jgi:hypothetical protein